MPVLFDNDAEKLRKENLKDLEDKRVRFAEKLSREGVAPERMLFCSDQEGRFVGLGRVNGKYAVVIGPKLGTEEDFILEIQDKIQYEREEIYEKGTGLNGAFGFGKKGANGFSLLIAMGDGAQARMDVIHGRTSYMEVRAKKNPLLSTKRRRGNANLVWEFQPFDRALVGKVDEMLKNYYLT